MNELPGKYMHQAISNRIIRGYYDVFDGLTYGLPESAYHRALHIALKGLELNSVGQLLNFGPEPEFERCFRSSDNETRPKSQEESEKSEGS